MDGTRDCIWALLEVMASQSMSKVPPKRKAGAPRAPRPRKKQAVTKTFKRSTIQKYWRLFNFISDYLHYPRIERNSLNSPLLSLPGEIREKILKLVVGDKVIHINVSDFGVKGQVAVSTRSGALGQAPVGDTDPYA